MNQTKFAIAVLAIVLSGVAGATAPASIGARADRMPSATVATAAAAARTPSGDTTRPGTRPQKICCMW